MDQTVRDLVKISDVEQKQAGFNRLYDQILNSDQIQDLEVALIGQLEENSAATYGAQIVEGILNKISALNLQKQEEAYKCVLSVLRSRRVQMTAQQQITQTLNALTEVCEKMEDWSAAARTLQEIDVDASFKAGDVQGPVQLYVRIARLWLEQDEAGNAETYIKKAAVLIREIQDEELKLQYAVCYSRILDSKRRFLEAAFRYYKLSSQRVVGEHVVSEQDLTRSLQQACVCACLAQAGPQRSRLLGLLIKDERVAQLPVYAMLQAMFLDRLLTNADVEEFKAQLSTHHLAIRSDGSTVLQASVVQHNVLAASRLYTCLTCSMLGELVGVSASEAMQVAANMVGDNRLQASIDQVAGVIQFKQQEASQVRWDDAIRGVCEHVNLIVGMIGKQQSIQT